MHYSFSHRGIRRRLGLIWALLALALVLAGCGNSARSPKPELSSTPHPPTYTPTAAADCNTPKLMCEGDAAPASDLLATPIPSPTPTTTPIPPVTNTPTPRLAPTPRPSPTLDQTSAVLPTAADPASPQPRPTTMASAALLAEADRAFHNGDYGAAAGLYQQFLDQYPGDGQAGRATFALGQVFLTSGQYEAATTTLQVLVDDAAFVAAHPEVLFWAARSHLALGEAAAAAAAWQDYAERRPLLASLAYRLAGDAHAAILNVPEAMAAYEKAIVAAPDITSALHARERIASLLTLSGDPAGAIAQYQAIMAQARNPEYRSEMLFHLGQAQAQAGDNAAAYASYQQAVSAAPSSAAAYPALVEIVNASQPVDELARGRIDFAAGVYDAAIPALQRYLDANPEHSGEPHVLMARAYEAQGNYAMADQSWVRVIDDHPGDAAVGQAWLGRGRSLWRQGDTTAAREVYLQAAERSPDPAAAAECLWWAATLAVRADDLAAAAADFAQLSQRFPSSAYGERARFQAGLQYFRLGDTVNAQAIWQAMAATPTGTWNAGADFWLGKIMQAGGDSAGAIAHWRGLVERRGAGDYYGVRALQAVVAQTGEDMMALQSAVPDAGDLATLAAWLRTWAPAPVPDLASPLPEFERADELDGVGETAAAETEFEALRGRWQDQPVRLVQLALHTAAAGYYDVSIRAAGRVAALAPTPFPQTPAALQYLMYPRYYDDLIVPAAQRHGLDPAYLYALVRQESLFGSRATSGAAARGLTQVIPSTGAAIAERLNWPNYHEELLYRPFVSIEFGAFYLSEGLQRTRGNIWEALAGYNGGPANSSYWRELAGPDDDLYVEIVGFTETQTYLRAIAAQSNHYRRLYEDLR